MKLNTTKLYPFTGDYYGYTQITDPNNPDNKANQYTTIPVKVKMDLSVNLLGELIIESLSKMQINGYLRNVVDKNGETIYENGGWTIIQTAPTLNSLGEKQGYKYRAKLFEGQI